MREIKFRAVHNSTKKMIYFSLYNLIEFPLKPWDQYEIMQFTGLKDKNGKELYEGDIIKYQYKKSSENGDRLITVSEIYEVYFDTSETKFWCKNKKKAYGSENEYGDPPILNWNEYEVIGNIYENPKLLKGGEQHSNNNRDSR